MCQDFKSDDSRDIKVCEGLVKEYVEFSLYVSVR